MKGILYPLIITIMLFFSQLVFGQTLYTVEVSNFSFTPAQLTISVGDTVKWTNVLGSHNVVADDGSFTSGAVSSSNWVYEFVFNTAGTYHYYCAMHGGPGGVGMSGVITVNKVTDVKDNNITAFKFELQQNYPNPFNPSTSISYQVPVKNNVTLKIYDVIGNEVAVLVNGEKPAGTYRVNWNAANMPSGVYMYKLQTGSFVQTKKMILMK